MRPHLGSVSMESVGVQGRRRKQNRENKQKRQSSSSAGLAVARSLALPAPMLALLNGPGELAVHVPGGCAGVKDAAASDAIGSSPAGAGRGGQTRLGRQCSAPMSERPGFGMWPRATPPLPTSCRELPPRRTAEFHRWFALAALRHACPLAHVRGARSLVTAPLCAEVRPGSRRGDRRCLCSMEVTRGERHTHTHCSTCACEDSCPATPRHGDIGAVGVI